MLFFNIPLDFYEAAFSVISLPAALFMDTNRCFEKGHMLHIFGISLMRID
jgi:hypothetical protein